MIAKRIPSPKGAGGFAQLGAYVLNAKRGGDPASWARLNAYVLDTGHGGEKVAWSRVSNCQSADAGWAVREIIATQAKNTRSRADKNYHLVVSFPEGEQPSRAQMEDIEDTLCAAIGFAEHQRVSATHQNTDNWHLHIAINKVHPRTFRNVEPWYDHYRLQECCAETGNTARAGAHEPWSRSVAAVAAQRPEFRGAQRRGVVRALDRGERTAGAAGGAADGK